MDLRASTSWSWHESHWEGHGPGSWSSWKASAVLASQENRGWGNSTWQDSSWCSQGNDGWENSARRDSPGLSWNAGASSGRWDPESKQAPRPAESGEVGTRETTTSREPELVEMSSDDSLDDPKQGQSSAVLASQENRGWGNSTWQDSSWCSQGNDGWENSARQDSPGLSWNAGASGGRWDPESKQAPWPAESCKVGTWETTTSREPELVEISSDDSLENWGKDWKDPKASGASWHASSSWSQSVSRSREAPTEAGRAGAKRCKHDPTASRRRSSHDDYDYVD